MKGTYFPSNNPRDYGLGTPETTSVPRLAWNGEKGDRQRLDCYVLTNPCPNCGGLTLFTINVDVKLKRLHGGRGTGCYLGCAACPYASPMICTAAPQEDSPCLSPD
jgi:hypothetical protein